MNLIETRSHLIIKMCKLIIQFSVVLAKSNLILDVIALSVTHFSIKFFLDYF